MDFEVFAADNLQKDPSGRKAAGNARVSERPLYGKRGFFLPAGSHRPSGYGYAQGGHAPEVEGALAPYVTVYEVEHVPSALPAYPDHDLNYIADQPGLFRTRCFPWRIIASLRSAAITEACGWR